jgi:MYXO-CTERM domain-containing protein
VECAAPEECREQGVCDPDTGTCTYAVAEDGAACDDGDGCTENDTCEEGVCTQGDPVTCQAQDACHLAGECSAETGECTNPLAPDGTECPEGTCKNGVCESGDDGGCGCTTGQSPWQGSLLLLGLFLALFLPGRRRSR